MTKIYQYFSIGFGSNVTLHYVDGLLSEAKIDAIKMDDTTEVKDKAFFFTKEETFIGSCEKYKIKYTELERVVTFEMFWKRYDYVMSGKKKAQEAWDKLSKLDQVQAYDFIPAYFSHLKLNTNISKKYACTYLNQMMWRK